MLKKIFTISALVCTMKNSYAQRMSPQEYIETYRDFAVAEMKRTGIPASITLAQGILESESGNSDLVKRSNNHFGIKCKSNWTGESVSHDDDEKAECFRKYPSAYDSYIDHSDFLRTSKRYEGLFKLDSKDYKGWAKGLKAAGYATNPKYPQILISNIEKYALHDFDILDEQVVDEITEHVAQVEEAEKPVQVVVAETPGPIATANVAGRFNGLKAVFAKAGTSMLALATNHGVKLKKFLDYNDLDSDGIIEKDQWYYLEEKNRMSSISEYKLLADLTVWEVSQITGVQLKTILELNSNYSQSMRLKTGTAVRLRSDAVAMNK